MKAKAGDWLIVHGRDHHEHHALILTVHGPDGDPPFTVRWSDDGHEAMVFPGPDATVMTHEAYQEHNEAVARRAMSIQSELLHSAE